MTEPDKYAPLREAEAIVECPDCKNQTGTPDNAYLGDCTCHGRRFLDVDPALLPDLLRERYALLEENKRLAYSLSGPAAIKHEMMLQAIRERDELAAKVAAMEAFLRDECPTDLLDVFLRGREE